MVVLLAHPSRWFSAPTSSITVIDVRCHRQSITYHSRPLRRYLQHTVETLIGRKIIAGQVEGGASLTVDVEDGQLVVK